ncbi:hypothetical protein [Victivallis sp. Marseille-Q1083]|uniref:hypothetical protein n=1 Tax=Victivallis sp. Marseille-Q1083 TaxID=2717288 RepID=UPI00158AEDA8|nr:hypothetical protein [Victivallis sp. Marseille-Q1083]
MKVLNVVLSVLILILAAASAVFSYLLFEKREKMASGIEKMATAISQAAQTIDANSGSGYAKKLTPDELGIKNTDALGNNLKEFSLAVRQVVEERDYLANSLRKMAATVVDEGKLGSEADFTNLTSYQSSVDTALSEVDAYKQRQDEVAKFLADTAGKMGASLKQSDFTGEYAGTAITRLGNSVQDVLDRLVKHQDLDTKIGQYVGAKDMDFVTPRKYLDTLKRIEAAATAFKQQYDESHTKLVQADAKISALQKEVTNRDGNITELKGEVSKLNTDIDRLKRVLDPDHPENIPPLWADGSADVRRATQGKVLEINDKFGFIVIDLGKNTRVMQQLGGKSVDIDPQIAEDMTMVVTRGLDGTDSQYIGRVKIFKVEDDCAFAQMESSSDKKIRVGDTVFFSDSDIAKTE